MSVTHADFTIERRYPYTPAQTFSVFADPAPRRQWFANPGGRYNEFRSRFHEIVETERIVFAYNLFHDHRPSRSH